MLISECLLNKVFHDSQEKLQAITIYWLLFGHFFLNLMLAEKRSVAAVEHNSLNPRCRQSSEGNNCEKIRGKTTNKSVKPPKEWKNTVFIVRRRLDTDVGGGITKQTSLGNTLPHVSHSVIWMDVREEIQRSGRAPGPLSFLESLCQQIWLLV